MSTLPPEPRDDGTPADRAAGAMDEDEYLGRSADGGADSGADGGADGRAAGGMDGGADGGADSGAGSGTGEDDPTTETEEDTRFA